MVVFPPITVRQPRPHDIVDDPVGVCGVGTGFEGVISAIAERFLGDADGSRAIFQANRDQIEDPDLIFSGQVLRIPQ